MLRIVFMGSDAIALPLLDWLAGEGRAQAEVVGVFTQPDRPVGRGQKVQVNAIKAWALERKLPVFQPEKLSEAERVQLAELRTDVALVMAYGHILRDDFIATPRLGTLNLHASILPKYRGASPIQTAIASGEKDTGVTLMRIVRKLDAGPVAEVERVPIVARDTALEIEQKLAAACVPLVERTLPKLAAGSLEFVAQDEGRATYCRRLVKDDGTINFNTPAVDLAARINGLFPWPGCVVEIEGQRVKIGLADAVETDAAPASSAGGEVLGVDAEGLRVTTSQGELRLLKLQRPGGKMLETREFLRGFPVRPGTILDSKEMLPLVANEPFPHRT